MPGKRQLHGGKYLPAPAAVAADELFRGQHHQFRHLQLNVRADHAVEHARRPPHSDIDKLLEDVQLHRSQFHIFPPVAALLRPDDR